MENLKRNKDNCLDTCPRCKVNPQGLMRHAYYMQDKVCGNCYRELDKRGPLKPKGAER